MITVFSRPAKPL